MPPEKCNLQRNECNLLCWCFQLQESAFKVEGWLSQQEASDTTKSSGKDQSIELVKTWSLDHIETVPGKFCTSNRFTLSESGAIGISCEESPSLSVIYPDTGKAPVILSNDMIYDSATFVKFRGKEHLAAVCRENGCLHLWDIESKTYKKVFDPKFPKEKKRKNMNICMIDESTIRYGETFSSFDGSRSVFILKKNTAEEWTLCETVILFTPSSIRDMCHMEMEDGSACLLLCVPMHNRIMAVEMEDGKTVWKAGKEQMGEKFEPWSICTNENNCAYVADFGQEKIHLLSASDGTVIKRFEVGSYYGIRNIVAVRFHNQHMYVENGVSKNKITVYEITKFKQIKKM